VTLTVRREELAAVEPEWRELLPRAPLHCAFVQPVWLRTWWEDFGAGRELILLGVRRDGGLAGVATLMREGPRLTFAGDTQICDYMDICVPGEDRADVLAAVLRSLGEEPWSEIVLWAVREDSPTLAALPGVCEGLGLTLEQEVEDVCPHLDLPPTVDEYLERLDKKDRHELRRKLRKLPQGGDVSIETLAEPDPLNAATDDFLRMHVESRAEKAAFMTPEMERFFRRVAPALAAEGMAEMVFLRLGGKRVACVLCFKTESEMLLYNSGYDPAYAGLSVGLLSKALALENAIERGYKKFDFLRGAEPYKYDLGAKDLKVYRCVIRRSAGT
jgi:CelD/BcsL family acetyltransferase involved in cellulose biosynthesis